MQITVGIATCGRAQQLQRTLAILSGQSRSPDRILIAPTCAADIAGMPARLGSVPCEIVHGTKGLAAQRNAILGALTSADLITFFDDDFYPAPSYLERVEGIFGANPGIVLATNRRLSRDGILGKGIPHKTAEAISRSLSSGPLPRYTFCDEIGAYGCNMTIRVATLTEHNLRFDERLPLYGWLEDLDFGVRIAAHGRTVTSPDLDGVHLGTKAGRTSGLRFGYSQVANPLYLSRKGVLSRTTAMRQLGRNFVRNIYGALRPEPWIDRRGRLTGNVHAIRDAALGRCEPEAILRIE